MAYTYDKQLWKDYPDTTTPITADRLNHMEEGIFNAAKNGGGESDKIGVIKMFSGSTAPDGWLICDGSLISRTDYSGLFNVIGTSYNLETDTDDTKFRLPNLKGRVPVGLNSSDDSFKTLGQTGGEKTHKLTVDEMPKHSHKAKNSGSLTAGYGGLFRNDSNEGYASGYINDTGGDQPHNNMQPYIVLNYIIKASATTSTQGEIIDSLDGNSTTNAPSQRAVNEAVNGYILYENSSGTSGSVSLNESKTNFSKLKILAGSNVGVLQTIEVPTTTTTFRISIIDNNGSGTTPWFKQNTYSLDNEQITLTGGFWRNVVSGQEANEPSITIYKVIGYK